MTTATALASLLQRFFTDRLVRQQRASPHTIASYRDAFRLLLRFAQERLGTEPSALALDDLDASFVGAFLDHVEQDRRNTARTRNVRLAAIHAFCRYVAISEPAHLDRCRRILAIPVKRYERRPIAYLTREEIDAVLAAPDISTWIGRRDRTLLLLAIQTGLRVSELIHAMRRRGTGYRRSSPVRRQGPQATLHAAAAGNGRADDGMAARAKRAAL